MPIQPAAAGLAQPPPRLRTVVSPVVLGELATAVAHVAAAVELCGAGLVRAAEGLTRCPTAVATTGAELLRSARLAIGTEADDLRRAARAIVGGAELFRARDVALASAMGRR